MKFSFWCLTGSATCDSGICLANLRLTTSGVDGAPGAAESLAVRWASEAVIMSCGVGFSGAAATSGGSGRAFRAAMAGRSSDAVAGEVAVFGAVVGSVVGAALPAGAASVTLGDVWRADWLSRAAYAASAGSETGSDPASGTATICVSRDDSGGAGSVTGGGDSTGPFAGCSGSSALSGDVFGGAVVGAAIFMVPASPVPSNHCGGFSWNSPGPMIPSTMNSIAARRRWEFLMTIPDV
ncbi:MAG: hypothetical protein VW495_01580 [Rhodobiaceae bacterium]